VVNGSASSGNWLVGAWTDDWSMKAHPLAVAPAGAGQEVGPMYRLTLECMSVIGNLTTDLPTLHFGNDCGSDMG
jgi:hypothetical protein